MNSVRDDGSLSRGMTISANALRRQCAGTRVDGSSERGRIGHGRQQEDRGRLEPMTNVARRKSLPDVRKVISVISGISGIKVSHCQRSNE